MGPAPDTAAPVIHTLPLLDSFSFYSLGPKEKIFNKGKMLYDGSGRLTNIYGTTTDTSEDNQPLRPDTLDFILTYHGSDSLPAAYTSYTANLSAMADHGFLQYDSQGRMKQDSGTNGQNSWLYNYQYNERGIIQSSINGTDSIIIVNDNVQLWKDFMIINSFTYGTNPNPFYQPALAKHIIPFMVFNGIDIFSKNLYSSSTAQYVNTDPYLVINYSWKTNANGQVISGTGTDVSTGVIIQYYSFTYQ